MTIPPISMLFKFVLSKGQFKQVIRVQKLVGLLPPHSNYLGVLGSEKSLLKLLRSAELYHTNSNPISNCWLSISAIFLSCNINYNINSLLRLSVGTHYISIYLSIYLSDERYIPEVEMKII